MNVIFIISDTFRRDHLGAYGNAQIHTPSLDSLAARSVRFDRHYMASFPTMPARADFLTGRWTMSFMQWEPLPRSEITIAQVLRNQDVHTAAFVDTPFYIRNGMDYDRDFHTFTEIPGQRQQGKPKEMFRGQGAPRKYQSECYAVQTISSSMRWLEENYKDNFFLMIDVWDPHEPWDAPSYYTEPYWPGYDGEIIRPIYGYWQKEPGYTAEKVRKAHATYCGEVTMVDTWIGYLLKQVENMGLMENTAIIFTTDHGYYFGEHGGLFGKMVFARDASGKRIMGIWSSSPYYEEVSALPLLIYMPGIKPGTYSGLTSAVDLMPTILDLFGSEIPSVVEGRSLLPMVHDPFQKGREYVVSAHPFINAGDIVRSVDDIGRKAEMASTAAITTKDWSLLYVVEPGLSELHHLQTDPKQEQNIIAEHPDIARDLHKILVDFMQQTKLPPRLLEPRLELRL